MGSLNPSDTPLHYEDGSHRWIAPPEIEQQAWEAQVQAHLDEHNRAPDGPPRKGRLQQRDQS